jgi:tetratricopeptide (TPR) repeat protein
MDARHAAAHYNRGLAFDQKGDVDRAMADYTKAIELEPTDPSPFINRGRIYMNRREYDRAIADYDKAFVVAPGLVLARFNKAVALDRAGRPQEATHEYRTFLQVAGPDDEANAVQARQRLAALEQKRE